MGLLIVLVRSPEARLLFECVTDGNALPLDGLGNHRGDETGLRGSHPHHASHVAHDATALELVEGGDLSDARLTVLGADVLNDAITLVHAEINVEVGHGHAFRVQEALEEEPVGDRVQVGDAKRPSDQ